MNQRLVWNFEVAPTVHSLPTTAQISKKREQGKWEVRYFWCAEDIIALTAIHSDLLSLRHYQQKYKEDDYFVLPNEPYNIKRRRGELIYKPLLTQSSMAFCFGPKITLTLSRTQNKKLQKILEKVMQEGLFMPVKKESFVYKFPLAIPTKLELARIEVDQRVFFSACIESRSQAIAEQLGLALVGKQDTGDYVTFLKKLRQHD